MRKDKLTKEQRSRTMSKIRSSKTEFENKVFRELRRKGLIFKTHYTLAIGKPDIALPRQRKAVFLHSDFWHGWRLSQWEHILPNNFWKEKLRKNKIRDRRVLLALRKSGWQILVVWEHQLKNSPQESIERIVHFLK